MRLILVKVIRRKCQSCDMDSSKLLHGFVKVVKYISRPLPNGTKMKFDLGVDFR